VPSSKALSQWSASARRSLLGASAAGNGETLLTCSVVDQAALLRLLRMVRDLGLPLISVTPVKSGQTDEVDLKPQIETSYSERRSTFDSTSNPC
jgi:hypothetical protein